MSKFSSWALIASLCLVWGWAQAAPPGGVKRGPVVIEPPVPEADPVDEGPAHRRFLTRADVQARDSEPAALRTAAEELSHARERLVKYKSIQARLVETVATYDRNYKAEGRYLQKGLKANDWQMRMELTLKVGGSEGSLLEVCDGDVLWTSTQIDVGRQSAKPKEKKDRKDHAVTRRSVTQILAAARKQGDNAETSAIADMGLGGLPALLASLERDMTFGRVREETLRDRPAVVLEATWNEEFLEKLRDPQQPKESSVLLPPFVPDSAMIYLDRETRFPLRFKYLKKIANRDAQREAFVLDFLEVELDQPIDKREFTYEPPAGVQPAELTNYFIQQIETPTTRGRAGEPAK